MCRGSGDKTKKGLNALVKEVKQLRFASALAKTSDSSDPSFELSFLPSASSSSSLASGTEEKKRRAPPADARRKKKKTA